MTKFAFCKEYRRQRFLQLGCVAQRRFAEAYEPLFLTKVMLPTKVGQRNASLMSDLSSRAKRRNSRVNCKSVRIEGTQKRIVSPKETKELKSELSFRTK